ncbi:polyadenylate-binding 2-like [Olea europaea subsp. europaea]|uniref:Polyadenylate-binding 2-like n=1 Tax=Olea europaea subsp. europaea TaxID=158383 RepID=A0A8S0PHU2_OLEEU|nr:polyadenylate-binding 2-like [Olea europaea subsp. europaea]
MAAQPPAMTDGGSQPVTALYVGDLHPNVTEIELSEAFSRMGDVISVKICMDHTTERSLGYGYVNYSNPQDAARALKELNFTNLNGKPIRISYSNRDSSLRRSSAGNIFVKNLDIAIDNKVLNEIFSSFGNIVSSKVETDSFGQSKGYGFVQYDTEEAAQKAINEQNGMSLYGKQVYVGHFETRERSLGLNNLYIKNLDDSIDDDKLKELFSQFGVVTSCKINCDAKGISKGSGFVAFSTPEEASRAILEMNKRMIGSKPLYVAIAERKEVRTARLQAQYSHMRPSTSVTPRMPMFTPGSPGPGQQIFYGHAGPSIISPMFVQGMRPTGPFLPNVVLPLIQPGPPGLYPGGRHASVDSVQQSLQPFPMMQQQVSGLFSCAFLENIFL